MNCAHCGFANADSAKFCENCGRPLERNCPNCGRPVSLTAKFCSNCGYNLAPLTTPSPSLASLNQAAPAALQEKVRAAGSLQEGERKLISVLFADIVGSTSLAEVLDPEDWRDVVSGAHRFVGEAVHRFEGHVAQLLGDGVLVFFGAPLAHEDDAERAVRSALAMLSATGLYADDLRARGLAQTFQLRVGINTGTVVVGNIGSDLHLEYLAIGDTVNLAARVQTAADPDTVFLTDNTRHLLGSLFDYEDRGRVSLKGKAEPVQIYRVLGERRGAVRARGVEGLSSPLVGRDRELATLARASADLMQGRGSIVSVLGEAGLGKSRLVAEWRRATQGGDATPVESGRTPAFQWAVGRCLSFTSSLPYYLAGDLLRGLIGVAADASVEQVETTLRRKCAELLGARAGDVYPFLANMLGLPLADADAASLAHLDGPALRGRYIAAFEAYLTTLAARQPVVIVADDIQWADPSSVELGVQVMRIAATAPVAFVLVSRPEPEAAGARLLAAARELPGVGSIEIHLAPLTEDDSHQLMENLLHRAEIPPEGRQSILAKAEGNPFYVEEVLHMLIDRGGLERRGERWVATRDLSDIEIPDTLQGVIAARVDRLPEEVKHTLQVAAVIGRRFPVSVLEAVLGEDDGKS